ncbi:MAG: hypothetical protein KGH91_05080 [Rhodospirillales bacterium]|nr:hypothetical protein [Rhodospirillales bacterium]
MVLLAAACENHGAASRADADNAKDHGMKHGFMDCEVQRAERNSEESHKGD